MQACIVMTEKQCLISELSKTLESLNTHGFEHVSFVRDAEKDDVWLFQGETMVQRNDHGETIVCYDGIKIQVDRGMQGTTILAGKNTPKNATILSLQSDKEQVLKEFVEQYPEMLESNLKMGQWYMQQHNYEESFHYFEKARRYRGNINKKIGWVEDCHTYLLDFEASLCAYYANEHILGRFYTDRLLMNPNISAQLLMRVYRNYEHYVQPLTTVWSKEYVVADMEKKETCDKDIVEGISTYKSLNPSLCRRDASSFYMTIRIVNWTLNPIGFNQYFSPHPKNKFKTKNLLAVIDLEGQYIQKPKLITKGESLDLKKIRGHHIDGFEDCRLFAVDEDTKIVRFITNYTKNNPKGASRLSIGTIDIQNPDTPQYTTLIPIIGHNDHLTQKNWLIYKTSEGKAWAVYNYQPFTLIQLDLTTGQAVPISEIKLPIRSSEFRGSAGPVPFLDGFLVVVHQVYFKDHKGRRYLHRFIKLDKEYVPMGISEAWYLQSKDIEYVSTMVALENVVLLGYGLCDKCACISAVSKRVISKMIRPIEDYL